MEALLRILIDPDLGSAASVIGLIVSLVGFAVTLYNVARSKRAAEEARNAVLRVQREISRLDAVADIATVITTMEEIKRLQRQQAWAILPDKYSTLRRQLVSIKVTFGGLNDAQRTLIQDAIQQLAGIEALLERTPIDAMNHKTAAKLNRNISLQIDGLEEVLAGLRMGQGDR